MTQPKKLIEVGLPLPEINDASAYDKMPGIGPHPKGIHHWWARLPLPTARAVLFASIVDDPSSHPEKWPSEEAQSAERERLFGIIRRMMQKQLHKQPELYIGGQEEMLKHCGGKLPAVFDPFAGGGSIPLEANRLGFEVHSADLNPVAVLLNKCNLEIIPRWSGKSPVNPRDRQEFGASDSWSGTHGLAKDIRYYAGLVRQRATARIGHLYPKVRLPKEYGSGEATAIAWLWARTVASPDPAAGGKHVPLVSTFWLSRKKGSEAWLEPVVNEVDGTYRFVARKGPPQDPRATAKGTKVADAGFRSILSPTPIPFEYIRLQGQKGALKHRLLEIVAEGRRGRLYIDADSSHESAAEAAQPSGYPDTNLPDVALGFRIQGYGITKHSDMFTRRQLAALVTLSDEVKGVVGDIVKDGLTAESPGADAESYAQAVITFLALALDRCADFNNAFCRWSASNQKVMNLFGRPAIPMVWDFAEANPLSESVGSWATCSDYVADCVEVIMTRGGGEAHQIDAATGANGLGGLLVSTDPPYYDNMGYGALSDFFYVWLRRSIGTYYPGLFGTMLVPKIEELTAAPERFDGDKKKAKDHFEMGFRSAFLALREKMDPRFPLTVYYAFKQDDEETDLEDAPNGTVDRTTGWETLLEALVETGFQITATWPVRASQAWRMRAMGANALASYIILACRPRPANARRIDRRAFVSELRQELPQALRHLRQGNIAPVDFAQAAIGPGMAVFSRYRAVLEGTSRPMTVRAALGLINQTLTEVLSEQEDEFDVPTRWALAWFEQQGFSSGDFGVAELLTKAKVTSVGALEHAGIVSSKGGKVRLLRPEELSKDWEPGKDGRITSWGITHHLVRLYVYDKVGEEATAQFLRKIGSQGEVARDLAYRLFNVCDKKKWSQEAQAYNALVLGWPEISSLARRGDQPRQERLPE